MSDQERLGDPSDGIRLVAGSASLVGKVRAANEDSLLVSPDVLVVADGMGGHLAGEVASAQAVEVLATAEGHRSLVELVSAVHLANRRISDRAADDPALRGMGTTVCVAGLVDEDGEHLAILNVGDSRVYLLADGELHQLTEDHSLVETLVREGRITAAEAEVHPQRNVLTRALGVEALVLVDAWLLSPCDGDRLLLCSDGLFNELSVERITEILKDQDDPDVAARRLAAEAEAAGGRDNVTAVVADVAGSGRSPAPYEGRYRRIATPAVDFDDPYRDASSDTAIVPLVPIIAVPPRAGDADTAEEDDDPDDGEVGDAESSEEGDLEGVDGDEAEDGERPGGPGIGEGGSTKEPDAALQASTPDNRAAAAASPSEMDGSPVGGEIQDAQASDGGGLGSTDLDTDAGQDLDGGDGGESDDVAADADAEIDAELDSEIGDGGGRTWRTPVFILAVVLVIAAAVGTIAFAVRSGWYVGAEGDHVVIYRGPARSLPILGDSIVEEFQDIHIESLPENKRAAIADGKGFSSKAKARNYVRGLAEETTTTTTTTTTTPTSTTQATTTTTVATTVAPPGTGPATPPGTDPGGPTAGGNGP